MLRVRHGLVRVALRVLVVVVRVLRRGLVRVVVVVAAPDDDAPALAARGRGRGGCRPLGRARLCPRGGGGGRGGGLRVARDGGGGSPCRRHLAGRGGSSPHQRPHARALGAATVPTTRGRGLQRSWRAGGRARGVNAQCGRAKNTPRTVGATVLPPPCTYDRAEKCAASAVTRATRWYRWCGRA